MTPVLGARVLIVSRVDIARRLIGRRIDRRILDPSADISNPRIVNSAIENATFFLAPGDTALATLRIFDPDITDDIVTANRLRHGDGSH